MHKLFHKTCIFLRGRPGVILNSFAFGGVSGNEIKYVFQNVDG